MEVTSVLKDILIPLQGKTISLKCSNKVCRKPMKVQVPVFSKVGINTPYTNDFQPTQILVQKRHQQKTVKIRILKNEKTEEQVFDLKEGKNTLGRMNLTDKTFIPDIPIFTFDKMISRNHCELIVQKKENYVDVILRDPKSKNGTFIPGSEKPLSHDDEIFLKDKDIFIVGETKIQIELASAD